MNSKLPFLIKTKENAIEELNIANEDESYPPYHHYHHFPMDLKEDRDIAILVMRLSHDRSDIYGSKLGYYPEALRADKEFVLKYLEIFSLEVPDAKIGPVDKIASELLKDKDVILALLKDHPYAFRTNFLEGFRDDDDIVSLVTAHHGSLMAHASPRCQLDRKLQAKSLLNDISRYIDIPESIWDTEFMREVYTISPEVLLRFNYARDIIRDKKPINEVLANPQMPTSFYLSKLDLAEDHLTEFLKVSADKPRIASLTRLLEHLSNQLPLELLLTRKSNLGIFNDIVRRRELLAINQRHDVHVNKKKRKI